MYCNNCGNEIDDSSKFCPHCGAEQIKVQEENKNEYKTEEHSFEKSKKLNIHSIKKTGSAKYSFISFLMIIIVALSVLGFLYLGSPEGAVYNSIVAMKDNDYDKTLKYVNINKIVDNRISALTDEMMDDPELENNPFAGLAYLFVEAIKPKLTSMIQDAFKGVVESPDNVFQNVSNVHVFLFTLIKNYDGNSLEKIQNDEKKVVFEFNNKDIKNLQIVLVKNAQGNWEIVDILGYDFWKDDKVNFLEHAR